MRSRLFLLFVALLAGGPVLVAGEDIQVVPMVRDGHVYVSFSLAGGLNEDVRASIRSGLPTAFHYEVELRQGVAAWFDRTVAWTTVTASARFDNLTRLHQLSRTVDGRLEDDMRTDDYESVRRWMTTFERLPLFSTGVLEPNGEYYVRVRMRKRPRVNWFWWPWDRSRAYGYAKFTFIP
jgi:hypothetical protein